MLTADHVRARRRGDELCLIPLKPAEEAEVLDLGSRLLVIFERALNHKRDELTDELNDLVVPPRLMRVIEGFKKLLFDRSDFESPEEINPSKLREIVFARASQIRAELDSEQRFDRQAVLIAAAAEVDLDIYRLDEVLFADLKGEQRLRRFEKLHPQRLLEEYKLAQEQAILLRASELRVRVSCDNPSNYRYLFRQLKFRRLLFEVKPLTDGSTGREEYELHISGPHNLFRASTKYGLQLALMLPALRICDRWWLSAQIRWGKERTPLLFNLDSTTSAEIPTSQIGTEAELPEEVETLLAQLKKHKSEWRARRSSKIIELPGVGLCVPDLVLSHPERKERVYFEVLGYWSREAVWRRVELVEAGLSERVIFAVSSRLRVSERALDEDLPGALLVYKGAIRVNKCIALLDQLVPPPEAPASQPLKDNQGGEASEQSSESEDH